jgi:hypothetical protein
MKTTFQADRKQYLLSTNQYENENDQIQHRREDHMKVLRLMADCVPTGEDEPLPGKGTTRCNRTACQTEEHVHFHNFVMNAKYCLSCAMDIRYSNDLAELDLFPSFNNELDDLVEFLPEK